MSLPSGFFELKTLQDLFKKLEHDFSRLESSPSNQYVAFDFFLTAEHMLDWELPGNVNHKKREYERKQHVLLQVCSHIASGAKHFVTEAPHHKSIKEARVSYGGFQLGGFQSNAFQTSGGLLIKLDGEAQNQLGESLRVISLAQLLLNFWKERLLIQ